MRFYRPLEWEANNTNIYLGVLGKLPYSHVFTAIGEWLEHSVEWLGHFRRMPEPSEWREIAMRHWGESERQKQLNKLRLTKHPDEPMTQHDLRDALRERAALGEEWATKVLHRLGTIGKQP